VKAVVAYDSVYGNTKLIADAIAEQITADGHSAELLSLREGKRRTVEADVLFVGGPTRFKKMTRPVKGFVKRLDKDYWSKRTLVVFDTYGPLGKTDEEKRKQEKWINPGAVGGIKELAAKRGLKVHPETVRFAVSDLKGPLVPDAVDEARAFAHRVLSALPRA
jgi:flavodoxin